MYGRQFNNIKIEFYYKDLPYAYTEINVNDKYNKGKLLEDDKINFIKIGEYPEDEEENRNQ